MNLSLRLRRFVSMSVGGCAILFAVCVGSMTVTRIADAACHCGKQGPHLFCARHVGTQHGLRYNSGPGDIQNLDTGGVWYWMRSPEEERRVVMNLFNRYCIRCHGVDGRGVWDIPDVPDFTNTVWQATRPDAYRSRVILEGRGAVMPSFRGTITVEESCALARYLHTFEPGAAVSRPDLGAANSGNPPAGNPPPAAAATPPAPTTPVAAVPSPPTSNTPSPFTR